MIPLHTACICYRSLPQLDVPWYLPNNSVTREELYVLLQLCLDPTVEPATGEDMTFHPLTQTTKPGIRCSERRNKKKTKPTIRYTGCAVYDQGQKVCLQQATLFFLLALLLFLNELANRLSVSFCLKYYQSGLLKILCYLAEAFHMSPYPSMTSLHVGHVGFPIRNPLWTLLASPTSSSQSGLGFGIVSFHPHVLPRQRRVGRPIGYWQLLW